MTNGFYFPHSASFRNDPRITRLIRKEGMAGYGIYWTLVEHLHTQKDYTGMLDILPDVARRCYSNMRRIKKVLLDYDLFVITETTFHSPDLCQRMKPFEEKFRKTSPKVPEEKEDKPLETSKKPVSPNNTNKYKIKETERKEINTTSSSSESEVVKKEISCETAVSEEEIFLKPVAGNNQQQGIHPASGSTDSQTQAHTATASAYAPSVVPPQTPAPTQETAPPPVTNWESWIDKLKDETRWKEQMSRHSRLTGYFFTFYDRLMTLFKEHIICVGKEHTIRCLSDAKRYFCCFCDPECYTGKRLYSRIQKEIQHWREVYIHEEYNAITGRRTYWGGMPIPADAPPRPHDRARWNTQTASWQ